MGKKRIDNYRRIQEYSQQEAIPSRETMDIATLAELLQEQIDTKLSILQNTYKEANELAKKIEALEEKIITIALELEPVEYLIKAQNPDMIALFNLIKKNTLKETDGTESH